MKGGRGRSHLHLVTSQRPRLVRKNVLDLTEFFDERGGSTESRGVRFSVIPAGRVKESKTKLASKREGRRKEERERNEHIEIRVDKLSLLVLDDFHGDDEPANKHREA